MPERRHLRGRHGQAPTASTAAPHAMGRARCPTFLNRLGFSADTHITGLSMMASIKDAMRAQTGTGRKSHAQSTRAGMIRRSPT